MRQYLDLCERILNDGVERTDRTGTGTISVFGHQMRFDLQKGFPLLTTKKVHIKSIIYELLWLLRGETNIRFLNEHGVTIWDEWRLPYSLDREVVFIDPINKRSYAPYNGDFSYAGLDLPEGEDRKLADTWVRMMRRCYDPSYHNYKFYGSNGISVCERWHIASNFILDVKSLPHWAYKQNNWDEFELDKDYYGSNQYAPDTCVWVHTSENNIYTKSAKPIQIVDSDGVANFFITLNEASRKTGIPSSTLSRFVSNGLPKILKGNNKTYLGWEFSEAELSGKLPRLKLIEDGELGPVYGYQWRHWPDGEGFEIDQITNVIERIKSKPHDRRLIVTAWNPADVDQMALPPCHCFFQFYVANGKLSCQMYQRSCDTFLGVPFNIASYALLTMMVAQVCDLQPGEFIHTLGDTHIYLNHIDQVKLQLTREPRPLPTMKINPEVKDIFGFKYEDFELIGYDPHPAIKGAISV